jgi:muramidase (phage lysozyme)
MAKVTYLKPVSDDHLKVVLQRFADVYGRDITVHSGDRHEVVKGSSTKSLHLAHRAADFHVSGMSDEEVFTSLHKHLGSIFDRSEGYEFIRHGTHTNTGGPHLHLGHYPGRNQGKVMFKLEGLTAATSGKYSVTPVEIPKAGKPVHVAPHDPRPLRTIGGPVGAGGANDKIDVRTVQQLLNAAESKLTAAKVPFSGFPPLLVDGISGPRTEEAIRKFQKEVVGMPHPDGRVDPNGKTLQVLKAVAGGNVPGLHATVRKATTHTPAGVKPGGGLTSGSPPEALARDPRVQAMLDVLGFTEGTGTNYGKVVNGTVLTSPHFPQLVGKKNVSVTDLSRHPDILVQVNSSIKSTAAGRYQFLKSTWDGLGMSDFSAASQDVAAVKLMKRRGMIQPLLDGDVAKAVHKGAPEWASLPTEGGGSYYGGQTARSLTEILAKYKEALKQHGG